MSITIPRPIVEIFTTPKLPIPALVAALAIELAITSIVSKPEPVPKCEITVEYPHLSESIQKNRGVQALKLNITSDCNFPQLSTEVNASIISISTDGPYELHNFGIRRVEPIKSNPNRTEIRDLYVECLSSSSTQYFGIAKGKVFLRNGKTVRFNENSKNFVPVNCKTSAK